MKDQNDPIFASLIAQVSGANFFSKEKNEESKDSNIFQIQLSQPIKSLKLKAFKEALGEAIRYLFYVSFALLKDDASRPNDSFDNASHTFQVISPTLNSLVPAESRGFKTDLAFGMLNIVLEMIRIHKDKNARHRAGSIVKAFQGGYSRIDVNQLKGIIKSLANRFQDQIAQMTISISTDGKLRLSDIDGIVQFANVIAKRIGAHIMRNANEHVDESEVPVIQAVSKTVSKAKINIQRILDQAQNIKAELPLPTLERCLLATWQEIDGYDVQIQCDTLDKGTHIVWLAGDILTHTGIRNIFDPNMVCERKDHFEEKVGYIYATPEEAAKRKYGEFHPIELKPGNNNNAPSPSMAKGKK